MKIFIARADVRSTCGAIELSPTPRPESRPGVDASIVAVICHRSDPVDDGAGSRGQASVQCANRLRHGRPHCQPRFLYLYQGARSGTTLTGFVRRRAVVHGLTVTQYAALATLARASDAPVAELARRLQMERTTTTRLVAPLLAGGLLARLDGRKIRGDGRARPLRLTSKASTTRRGDSCVAPRAARRRQASRRTAARDARSAADAADRTGCGAPGGSEA
jgi:DNA-binding MarR family transcriptional regulator